MALLRLLRAELNEIYVFRLRYFALLALALCSVALAGSLAQVTIPARGILFTSGLSASEQEQIVTFLSNFSNVDLSVAASPIDPAEMRRRDAAYGLGVVNGRLSAVWNGAASEQVALQVTEPPPDAAGGGASLEDAIPGTERDLVKEVRAALLANVASITLLPYSAAHTLVVKVLAFVVLFAPFLFALEGVVRQRQSQMGPLYMAGSKGRLGTYCLAKIIIAALLGTTVFFAALVMAGALFSLLPTEGLTSILLLYVPAAIASASLGVAIGLTVESNRAMGAVTAYFLALLLFGGMFLPLSSANPLVQAASYMLPLRYVLTQFHLWLLEGHVFDPVTWLTPFFSRTPPRPGPEVIELTAFATLLLGYLLLVPISIWLAKNRT